MYVIQLSRWNKEKRQPELCWLNHFEDRKTKLNSARWIKNIKLASRFSSKQEAQIFVDYWAKKEKRHLTIIKLWE